MPPTTPDDDKPDVLSSLPSTRPQRRSARRDAARKPRASVTSAKQQPAARGAAKPKAGAAKPRAAATKPRATAKAGGKRATVSAVPPRIPPAGFAPPRDSQERPAPSGTELVGTAIQAAGELVQIGAAIGGQALKSALGRLGRS